MVSMMERYERAKKKPFKIFDVVIVVLVLLIGILFCAVPGKETGNTVLITSDGKLIGEYELSKERTVEVDLGDERNIIKISGGKVSMVFSTCAGGDCVSVGEIAYDGQKIICLPNKLIVEIISKDKTVDGVV